MDKDFKNLPKHVQNAIIGFWDYPVGPFECPTGIDPEIWKKYTYGSDDSGIQPDPPQPVDDDIHFIVKKEEE